MATTTDSKGRHRFAQGSALSVAGLGSATLDESVTFLHVAENSISILWATKSFPELNELLSGLLW